jgi:hypothetical protein
MTIPEFCDLLRTSGIHGVDGYQKKLQDNEKDARRLQDLGCEGEVALAFVRHGWTINMGESPDLEGRLNGIYLGIEVKHFRFKESHDPVEDAARESGGGEFYRIPFLSETEGPEQAWDQMYRIAVKNAHQYKPGEFNVLFFWSSTQAHCDIVLLTAANKYDEALQSSQCSPAMRNLSAMMIKAVWGRYGSIFLQPLPHAEKPLSPDILARLDDIRDPSV